MKNGENVDKIESDILRKFDTFEGITERGYMKVTIKSISTLMRNMMKYMNVECENASSERFSSTSS